jgi:hypothetical protein
MAGRKNKREATAERLDRVGREILRAAASEEAEQVAASPFLYTRIRARIAAERERREEGERWLAVLGVVWRAVPAMALVAVFAFSLFMFMRTGATAVAAEGFGDEVLLGAQNAGLEQVVFTDARTLSGDDEVLTTILADDEAREVSR